MRTVDANGNMLDYDDRVEVGRQRVHVVSGERATVNIVVAAN